MRDGQIDVEELICELHHIAGSERIDVDVRKVAAEAESALAALRAWVHELQMNTAERRAVGVAMQCVEAARCQRHPEEESEADLLHSVYHTLGRMLDRVR